MKKLMLIAIGIVCVTAVVAQVVASNTRHHSPLLPAVAAFSWDQTTYDFGKIKLNDPVSHDFTFVNSGDATLVISGVKASCGCTVTDYSKDPIEPNQQGYVRATYNAAKPGVFSKTVTVHANAADGTMLLTIKGEVTE